MVELTEENYCDVLGECKVYVTKLTQHWQYEEIAALPLETVPPCMLDDECWRGDHWCFSTVSARVLSTIGTWQGKEVCVLQLRRGGFVFQELDLSLLEEGAGI